MESARTSRILHDRRRQPNGLGGDEPRRRPRVSGGSPGGENRAAAPDHGRIPPAIATARRAGWPRFVLSLGVTAFGGPAAHVAMMREEVVLNGSGGCAARCPGSRKCDVPPADGAPSRRTPHWQESCFLRRLGEAIRMTTAAFDTHSAVKQLRAAGVNDEQAETLVDIIGRAIGDPVTKADLEPLATKEFVRAEIAGVDGHRRSRACARGDRQPRGPPVPASVGDGRRHRRRDVHAAEALPLRGLG